MAWAWHGHGMGAATRERELDICHLSVVSGYLRMHGLKYVLFYITLVFAALLGSRVRSDPVVVQLQLNESSKKVLGGWAGHRSRVILDPNWAIQHCLHLWDMLGGGFQLGKMLCRI